MTVASERRWADAIDSTLSATGSARLHFPIITTASYIKGCWARPWVEDSGRGNDAVRLGGSIHSETKCVTGDT
jgi:hypothetical protein